MDSLMFAFDAVLGCGALQSDKNGLSEESFYICLTT
jgi:hypothetical protein